MYRADQPSIVDADRDSHLLIAHSEVGDDTVVVLCAPMRALSGQQRGGNPDGLGRRASGGAASDVGPGCADDGDQPQEFP